ncbi:MAG: signal recognition particle protein [Anaerolineae bacterium]|jgi:signal recognition particle subunit SRP54|nr:signal recognition particle protein [Anaerolineae bacterium]
MFEGLSKRLQETFDRLGKGGKVTEEHLNTVMRDVRMALLEADVALPVVKDFVGRVRERAVGAEVHKALRPAQQVVKIVHEELTATLGEPGRLNFATGAKPHVIMLVGLQGSGKTTTAAKLATHLRREGRQPYLVACDVYRPAAVDQLKTLGKQVGVQVYDEGTAAKPIDIAKNGVEAAKKANAAVVILDTAGRLQIDDQLMNELEEIKRRTNPSEVILVADAMTGQEAVNIAQGFNTRVGITGLILTKIDGDARGGAAISMRAVTNVPIKYLGTSEKMDGFEVFHPDRLVDRILGMGDMMSLIEKAEEQFDQAEAEKLQEKLMKNQFTLQDFLEQLQRIRKMGPLGQLMGMIPGMSKVQMSGQVNEQDMQKRLKRVEAIIFSMTAKERDNPKVLNASRRRRIAAGAGVQVRDVNEVLNQFQRMQDMMAQIRKGKFPKIPGMPNLFG